MSTMSNLSSGLFGGVLGGLLAFGAAWFTIIRTRAADREREARRNEQLDEERRIELAGRVAGTIRALESEIRWAPFLKGRTSAHLLEMSMAFYASQKRNHPEVATWLLEQVQAQHQSMDAWRRWWWVPFVGSRLLRPYGESLGGLSAAIMLWATGDLTDEAFSDPSVKPQSLVAGLNHARELVNEGGR